MVILNIMYKPVKNVMLIAKLAFYLLPIVLVVMEKIKNYQNVTVL